MSVQKFYDTYVRISRVFPFYELRSQTCKPHYYTYFFIIRIRISIINVFEIKKLFFNQLIFIQNLLQKVHLSNASKQYTEINSTFRIDN